MGIFGLGAENVVGNVVEANVFLQVKVHKGARGSHKDVCSDCSGDATVEKKMSPEPASERVKVTILPCFA